MGMKWMSSSGNREERGDERRQEGVRSLPVPAFHLAIHTAAVTMVCGSFLKKQLSNFPSRGLVRRIDSVCLNVFLCL